MVRLPRRTKPADHPGDPSAQLRAWLKDMAAHVASGDERGCPLANAAVELPEKDHPARRVIEAFKTAQRERLVQLCAAAALAEPEMLADELFLLLGGVRLQIGVGPTGIKPVPALDRGRCSGPPLGRPAPRQSRASISRLPLDDLIEDGADDARGGTVTIARDSNNSGALSGHGASPHEPPAVHCHSPRHEFRRETSHRGRKRTR
jgi:hypothetical protein